jgi:Ca-activated chloride channel family protein
LIGYETRSLNREDFNNDKVDAGDIGAGHTVTAIYEMTPVGSEAALVDDLRYQAEKASKPQAQRGEYAFVKIRYKLPDSSTSKLIEKAADGRVDVQKLNYTSDDTRFATAVAGFAQLLRGDAHLESFGYDDVIAIAQGAKGDDPFGYRAEFINLVRLAKNAASLEPLAQ